MAVSEKNAVKKPHFNIIDLLIVLVVLAVVCTVIMRYDVAEKIDRASSDDNVRISFLVQRVYPSFASEINKGDELVWDQADLTIGNIIEVQSTKAIVYTADKYGQIAKDEDDKNVDIRFTVDTFGEMTDDGYLVSGTNYIAPGCSVTLHNDRVTMAAQVISMETVD